MAELNIPEGYQQLMPYLIIANAAKFISFMQTVFDATEKLKTMRDEHTIMHAELSIGGCTIMLADATENYPASPAGLFIYVADCDAVYERSLANGATSIFGPCNQDYGRSAGIKDAFGNTWWITAALN